MKTSLSELLHRSKYRNARAESLLKGGRCQKTGTYSKKPGQSGIGMASHLDAAEASLYQLIE